MFAAMPIHTEHYGQICYLGPKVSEIFPSDHVKPENLETVKASKFVI